MKNQKSPIGIVIVNTKGNWRNLNFIELPLYEICGTRVTALIYDIETDNMIQADFHLREIDSIYIDAVNIERANYLLNG